MAYYCNILLCTFYHVRIHRIGCCYFPSPFLLVAQACVDLKMPIALMLLTRWTCRRSVLITGDDFQHEDCGSGECTCTQTRSQCTLGLHAILIGRGTLKLVHSRFEKCGQRGVNGRYCVHMHVGDRIALAPTVYMSRGHAQSFVATNISRNAVWLARDALPGPRCTPHTLYLCTIL